MFTHKFTSVYGESAVDDKGNFTSSAKTWGASLSDVTHEQIINGMRACKDSGEGWPPSIPKFVAMCKGSGANEFGLDYVPEYHRSPIRSPEKILSSDTRDAHRKEVSKKAMGDLRGALKRNKNVS